MSLLRDLWSGMRDTTFVVAQVLTLGVIAMVLGLIALNAALGRPADTASPTPPSGPSGRLAALVPTIVASTATATPRAEPTATLFVPPGFAQATATAVRAEQPAAEPTRAAAAAPPAPTATPQPPEPTAAPPSPATPTRAAQPTPATKPTANPTGQLMKVLPAADGLPARVRAEPNTKAPILLRVPLGATVEVIGQASGDEVQPGNARWLRIRWKEQTGWVYSSLVGE